MEVWRWLGITGVAGATALACNAYDESLAGHEKDARAPSGSAGAGGGVIPPVDGANGGGGGIGTGGAATGGAGGNSSGTDGPPGGPDDAQDSSTGPDVSSVVDGAKDSPATAADAGQDVGPVVDVRSEPPPPVQDVLVMDTPVLGDSMIDDMEDPDDAILTVDGRRGAWFVLNDASDGGVQSPAMGTPFNMTAIPGGRGASMYAVHTSGKGFTAWSPLIGFWLKRPPAALKQVYDASRFNAITFWAKTTPVDAANFSASVRVQLPDKNTDPDGQVCTVDGSLGCSDHFGRTIILTPDWVKYTIRFTGLQQAGFGQPAPSFDAAHVYGIEFQFTLASTFDCWIDDISFASL